MGRREYNSISVCLGARDPFVVGGDGAWYFWERGGGVWGLGCPWSESITAVWLVSVNWAMDSYGPRGAPASYTVPLRPQTPHRQNSV